MMHVWLLCNDGILLFADIRVMFDNKITSIADNAFAGLVKMQHLYDCMRVCAG